ncbi:unnamed protein product [Parnassius apollo]|uniref:(apollo) hypothetical protein n=1 Tax=Parnassius apollo TaxID=110799 RepID=A0A8S3Y3C6_PARAO|nr:unnamed protein product [Parnassius apollo]
MKALGTGDEFDYEIGMDTNTMEDTCDLTEKLKRLKSTEEYPHNDLRLDKTTEDSNDHLESTENAKNKETEKDFENDLINHETENNENTTEYFLNDYVLGSYYNRNKWTYYIGYIETITTKNYESYFMVRFFKTIKKPKLVFKMTKKRDRDEITEISIVKKVHLTQNPLKSNEYLLSDEDDKVYF